MQVLLDFFKYDYRKNISSWKFDLFFRELEPKDQEQKDKWEQNRKKVYAVSRVKFIKSLYHNTLLQDGFLLTRLSLINPNVTQFVPFKLPVSSSIEGEKEFFIPDDLNDLGLICYGRPVEEDDLYHMGSYSFGVTTPVRIQQFASKRLISSVGLYKNRIYTPFGAVKIYPDGTYSNVLQLNLDFNSESLAGLNMLLPLEYNDK